MDKPSVRRPRNRSQPTPGELVPKDARNVTEVPSENVELLSEVLGLDLATERKETVLARVQTLSISASPYPSADMLAEYREKGFPDLPAQILTMVDQQISHRQKLEALTTDQAQNRLNRGQLGAMALGFFAVGGALVAGYFGVPVTICAFVVVLGVGGPNAATVASRLLDRR